MRPGSSGLCAVLRSQLQPAGGAEEPEVARVRWQIRSSSSRMTEFLSFLGDGGWGGGCCTGSSLLCMGFSLIAESRGMGSVAPQHVGSSWTRDQTCVPYTGREILNHWTTREVPILSILEQKVTATCSASFLTT